MSQLTNDEQADEATTRPGDEVEPGTSDDTDVLEELLVEEVSIDGMCGVY